MTRTKTQKMRAKQAGTQKGSMAKPNPPRKKDRPTRQNKKRARRAQSQQQGDLGTGAIATMFAPVSEGTILKSLKPQFFRDSHDSQRIIHREKVGKYVTPGSGAFTQLAAIALNPGVAASFPWLSNEAAGWERYRFNALRYIWVPAVGTAVAGDIIMGPDYDAADPAPYGETALSSYENTEEGNVWCRFAAELDPANLHGDEKQKYLRFGNLAPNQDIKTYDCGNFFLYSSDDAAAQTGKLWVEYDVTLINPQVPPGGFQASGVIASSGGGTSNLAIFGATPLSTGPVVLTAAGNVLTISNVQVGQRISVATVAVGTVMSVLTAAPVGLAADVDYASMVNAGATNLSNVGYYSVTAPNPTITYTCTATTVTNTTCVVTVLAPVPAGF
jgi:hypothetical protein